MTIKKDSLLVDEDEKKSLGSSSSTAAAKSKPSPIHRMLTDEKRQTSLSTIVDKEACGEYILIDIIGKGGFGVVYKALHATKGYFSAIKKIRITKRKKGDQQQAESQSSLMVEINLLKVLSHHNIVRYYDHIPTVSHSYIVMEFIENGSLEKMIKRHGLLPESLVNVYMAQVLGGLEYLHRQGVIHRDIKAANLLISTDGSIKLADFGVATKVSDLSADNPDDSFAGTPYWMAPEVIQMQGVSTACDVWSLGCTIIELLTGTPPYFGLAPAAALYKIVQEDHPPIPQGISAALKDFLLQCFKKDENMRSSAKQLLNHPWIKAVVKNPDNQVKNPTMEILTYNAQLQEGMAVSPPDIINRPRSKQGPIPIPSTNQNGSGSGKGGSWISTTHTPNSSSFSPQQQSSNITTIEKQTTFGMVFEKKPQPNLQIATPRQSSSKLLPEAKKDQEKQQMTNQSTNQNQSTPSQQQQQKQEANKINLQKYADKSDDEEDDMFVMDKKPLKQKLQKYVENDDDSDSDFFKSTASLPIPVKKPATIPSPTLQSFKDDDQFGFSDEDEVPKKLSISSSSTRKPSPLLSSASQLRLKLQVRESSEEWDSEIEDTFDSVSAAWNVEQDTLRTINNLQDKQKEQVTRTIVDLLAQLLVLSNQLQKKTSVDLNTSMEAISSLSLGGESNLIDKLIELFQRFPEERRLLISNGEGGIYLRLPLITMLEILEIPDCPPSLVLSILCLINESMCGSTTDHAVNSALLETVCILNGIPIITTFAHRNHAEAIREQVSKFVHRLCVSSSYSLNMFIAGSRGCKVLVDLVDSDYFNSSNLIHNALDSISQIFKVPTALPKTSLCHLFSRTQLLPRISILLHQIFIANDQDTPQQLDQKTKVKGINQIVAAVVPTTTGELPPPPITNNHLANSKNSSPSNSRGSSIQILPKDTFDRVLSYSVKAADIMLFFSTGDSLIKEEMSSSQVLRPITQVLEEIHTWGSIASDVRAFLLRMLKVIKNLSMDQSNRSKLDEVGIIPTLINYLGYHQSGIEKISEIYNQVLHSLYYLLLLDKSRQDKALKCGILAPLLFIINERGPLKELALPILFDFVRLTSPASRAHLWQCDTLTKLITLLEDHNWFADAIESIAAWAQLEPKLVYDRLIQDADCCQQLIGILHTSHIKHPSFPKSLIPLFQLMNGSQALIGKMVSVGLINHLVECLEIDQSPVSKITLLKIVGAVKSAQNVFEKSQSDSLYATLQTISKQDESQINEQQQGQTHRTN
ncbi:putative protein serine/threonine kinase [Cavenderia fasciculata]|uniref:non-specific serine/threonine protein kinase n=1 Tax=Cavenderia fasciculata TaxID=261658 RepID=F4PJU2_CACFS|nr:putative protein serine/threonine kinase [Cavenderia fasciculata]EGG23866.1 putative protein serine/threonine kinase [Cavenderia fasciculata]|eukprot:XP_004361717.1 putative protein serine/threonine kinase [Cavenderia fasciculata]